MTEAINDLRQQVNATKITINITYFDFALQIHTLQYTYFDFTHENCQAVPATLTCYYTPADTQPSVDTKLIPYLIYCMALMTIIIPIIFVGIGWYHFC